MAMEQRDLSLTKHARQRGIERAITPKEMCWVAVYGQRVYAGGRELRLFGVREREYWQRTLGDGACRLEGLVVVLSRSGTVVITTYWDLRSLPRSLCKRDDWRHAPAVLKLGSGNAAVAA